MTETYYSVDTGPRGCGASRTIGGVYAELPLGPFGKPVEEFLVDPPIIIDPERLGVSPVGVKLTYDVHGTPHLLDWIGSEHYPNVADMIEEIRHMGMSRRLPANKAILSELGQGSKIVMIHARGHIENRFHYYELPQACPKNKLNHECTAQNEVIKAPEEMCVGLYWQDIQHGEALECDSRLVDRTMPSFTYTGFSPPEGVSREYKPAIFAAFPIASLGVVKGDDGEHEKGLEAAHASMLNVNLTDS